MIQPSDKAEATPGSAGAAHLEEAGAVADTASTAVPAFAADTALTELGDGRFSCSFNRRWFVVIGPNGGLTAALVLEAAMRASHSELRPRSLTVHYLSSPVEGDAELEVHVERQGRSVTFLRVSMHQTTDGTRRPIATGLVVMAAPRSAPFEWQQRRLPEMPAPEDCFVAAGGPVELPIRQRWEQRWGRGVPGQSELVDGTFHVGGWIRLTEPVPYSPTVLAAMSDAWVPASMVLSDEAIHTPTLELTVHFRADVAGLALAPDDFCLAVFTQHTGAEGYLDESGEIWSADGSLLVMCRQLGLVLPREGGAPDIGFVAGGPLT